MPSADQIVAKSASALFDSWAVHEVLAQADALAALTGDETIRPLLRGVDALIRQGLREQCESWPREWSTDGVSAYRCVRLGAQQVEIVGLCWAFTAHREAFASFPVRVTFELDSESTGLSWFRCEIGDVDPTTGEVPQLPEGTMILFEPGNEIDSVQLLVGRRTRAVAWTPTIDMRFP